MTTQSVTERATGTIPNSEEQAKVASSEKGKTPDEGGKVSSSTPKTYTEKELRDAVKAAEGRAAKAEELQRQVDTFKSQVEQAQKEAKEATTTLEETREHIANLESDIETLEESETDPNKLSKLRKELRDARGKVKQEVKDQQDAIEELRKSLEAERLEWAGTVAEAQAFKFDGELAQLVDEYEGDVPANFTKLKTACDKAGVKTKEGAEAIAETFLTKKVEQPDLINDSGVTSGSGDIIGNLPVADQIKILNERVLKKMK